MRFYTVISVTGSVFIRNETGESIALKPGDRLPSNAVFSASASGNIVVEDAQHTTLNLHIEPNSNFNDLLEALAPNEAPPSSDDTTKVESVEHTDKTKSPVDAKNNPIEDDSVIERGHHHAAAETVERDGLEVQVGAVSGMGARSNDELVYDEASNSFINMISGGADSGVLSTSTVTPSVSRLGNSASNNLPIQITGTSVGSVVEDQTLTATGQFSLHGGAGHIPAQTYTGLYGTLSLAANGQWEYQLNNSATKDQALAEGEKVQEHFNIHALNSAGMDFKHSLIIDITGTNDHPIVDAMVPLSAQEGDPSIHGQVTATDVDHGDTITFSTTVSHAGFTLHSDGRYSFDPKDPSFQHLAVGEHETITIPVVATDSQTGKSTPQNLVITIGGTDNLPVVNAISAKTVDEDGTVIHGQVTSTDIDTTDTVTYSSTVSHSGFVLHADGRYTLDPTDASFQHLAVGEHETLTIPVIATDNHGGNSIAQNIVITINGTNDIPVIGSIAAKTVSEGSPIAYGLVGSTDVDHGDTATYSTPMSQPGFTLNKDGSYTFDPSNKAYDHLAFGEHQTLTIPVTATDNQGGASVAQNIVITINGTNDIPVIGSIAAKTVSEGSPIAYGLVGSTDVDHGDTATYSTPMSQPGFTLNKDGSYTFDPANKAYDHLAVGEHETLTIPVTATDNQGEASVAQNIVITINGTNDIPVIGSIAAKTVSEGSPIAYGLVGSTDVDHGDTATYSTPMSQPGFTLNKDGSYTFDPSNKAYDHLAFGEHETLTIPIVATDNHGSKSVIQNLVITVNGTNDAPVVSAITDKVVEDASSHHTVDLLLHASDIEGDAMHIAGIQYQLDGGSKTSTLPPGVSIAADGHTLIIDSTNQAYQHLAAGQTQAINVSYMVVDSHGAQTAQTATLQMVGTNDSPVVTSSIQLAQGTEDTAITLTSAQLLAHASDIDDNDAGKLSISNLQADHGTIVENKDGTYTFTPTANYNGNVHFTYDIHDAHGGVVTTGATTNLAAVADATILNTPATADLTEDHIAPSDIIRGDLNTHWSTLDLTDPDGGTPSIAAIEVNGVSHAWSSSVQYIAGHWGSFELGDQWPQGVGKGTPLKQWLYSIDNDNPHVQALGTGEQHQETMTIVTSDGTRIPITVTLTGVNDTVVLDTANLGQITEGGSSHTMSGQLHAHDPDQHDSVHFQATSGTGLVGSYGHLTIDTQGNWHYTLDQAKAESLPAGSFRAEWFSVKAISTDGSEVTRNLQFNVMGSNQAAHISDVQTDVTQISATEGSHVDAADHINYHGQLHITDVDKGEASFDHGSGSTSHTSDYTSSLGGTLTIDKLTGQYHYSIDNNNAKIQALGAGQHLTDSIDIQSTDGTHYTINITINGSNTNPVASSAVVLANGIEDTVLHITQAQLTANITDVDANDAGKLHVDQVSALKPDGSSAGVVTQNHDGSFTFTPSANYNGAVSFHYDVKDAHGGHVSTEANTQLAARDDASVITGKHADTISEGDIGDTTTATGTLTISDIDKGDNPTFHDVTSTATTYGHITMVNGKWTYTLDQSKVQDLDPNSTDASKHQVIDTYTFTASDGSTQTVSITVMGTNDAPVIESAHAAPSGATNAALKIQSMEIVENPTGANIDVRADWGVETSNVPAGAKLVGLYKPGSDHNYIDPAHPGTMTTAHSGAGGFARVDNHGWFHANGVPDTVNTGAGGASGHGNAWQSGVAVFEFPDGHQEIAVINRVCTGGGAEVDYLYFHTYQNLHPGAMTLSGEAAANEQITIKEGNHVVASVTADAHGHWAVAAIALQDGKHTLHVENANGEQSPEHVYQISGHRVDDVTPAGLDAEINEDAAQTTIDGELKASDADAGDNPDFVPQTNIATQYGHFTLLANGQYHYTIDNSNPSVNALGVHQTLQEHISVTAKTADGETVTHHVNVTINGTVDAPTLSTTAATVQQGSAIIIDLNASLTDTGGDSETLTVKISGLPDHATLNHGTHDTVAKMWILSQADLKGLTLDMKDPNFHGDLHFNVTATASASGESESTTQSVSLHVNAPPSVAHTIIDSVAEGSSNQHNVDLLEGATDAEGHVLSVEGLSYKVGSNASSSVLPAGMSLAADGHTLTLDATHSAFNHLAQGETETIVITYNIKDPDGGSVAQTATFNIMGTNDTPTISGSTSATEIIEDHNVQSNSNIISSNQHQINVSDVDDGESLMRPTGTAHGSGSAATGTWVGGDKHVGEFIVHADGRWLYKVSNGNSVIQSLNAGEVFSETITVHTKDGTPVTLTATVTGTNDVPTITTNILSGQEDQHYQFTQANFGFNDVDAGAALHHITITQLPNAIAGKLMLNGVEVTAHQQVSAADIAHLQFVPTANFNGDVHFAYTVSDGTANSAPAIMKLDVSNINDAAHIHGDISASATEDLQVNSGQLLAQGVLQSSDIDNPNDRFKMEILSQQADGSPAQGTLTMGSRGHWVYGIDNASVQHLASGKTLTETFTVHSIDGTPQTITATIVGSNDVPTLTVQVATNTTGQLSGSDIDDTDQLQYDTIQPHGHFGQLQVDPLTGAYSYHQTASVAGMNFDPATGIYSAQEVFEVRVSDGHGGQARQFVTFDVTATVTAPAMPGGMPTITTQVVALPVVSSQAPQIAAVSPPVNGVTIDLDANSDTGQSHSDDLTRDTTPSISGTTDIPFSRVEILDGTHVVATTTSDAQGHYRVDAAGLSDSAHSLQAQATAPSSATAVVSSPLAVTVDSHIAALTVALSHDSGNTSDHITNDGALVLGNQETGATVEYSTDGGQHWSQVFTPQQGDNTVTLRQTDAAGNVSPPTTFNFTLDTTVAAPTVSLRTDSGDSQTDKLSNQGTLTVVSEPGAVVEYSTDGGASWQASFNPQHEGPNTVLVRQTDVAGNSASTTFSFDYDVTKPVFTLVQPGVSNQPIMHFSGTASLDVTHITVDIVQNNGTVATLHPMLDGKGGWSVSSNSLPDGDYTVSVYGVDEAGNKSPMFSGRVTEHFTIDSHIDATTVDIIDAGNTDNVINLTESTAVTITGTIDPTAKLTRLTVVDSLGHSILLDVNKVTVNAQGHFQMTGVDVSSLADGQLTVNAIATDAAGNSSPAMDAISKDTVAPVVPLAPVIQSQHQTGSNAITIHSSDHYGGFALTQFGGADIRSPYGTAHIDPLSGHVTFSPIGTGNPHAAHHGNFEIYQHGQHVADIHVTSWNHNHQPSIIEVTPVVVQHDEPEEAVEVLAVELMDDKHTPMSTETSSSSHDEPRLDFSKVAALAKEEGHTDDHQAADQHKAAAILQDAQHSSDEKPLADLINEHVKTQPDAAKAAEHREHKPDESQSEQQTADTHDAVTPLAVTEAEQHGKEHYGAGGSANLDNLIANNDDDSQSLI